LISKNNLSGAGNTQKLFKVVNSLQVASKFKMKLVTGPLYNATPVWLWETCI